MGMGVAYCTLLSVGMSMATCTASSEHTHAGYECEKAFDGSTAPGGSSEWSSLGDGVRAWINIVLDRRWFITEIGLYQRCQDIVQADTARIQFDNSNAGDLVSVHWE